ncbi:MAG: glycosyltransferase [Bacteroidetes bacterium]|nr:glycosyltransferase [Bacteroidota bacterium]
MVDFFGYFLIGLYCVILTYILIYCLFQFQLLWKHYLGGTQMPEQLEIKKGPFPTVTIQLPIFNEMDLAERIIEFSCKLDYPKERLQIQVLDDSTDTTLAVSEKAVEKYRQQGFDIELIHRAHRTGYKAGALREGMKSAKGEYIAIFDADFIPSSAFLIRTLPHFSDDRVGVVQTRWMHINENYSLLTRLQAFQLNVHFMIEQSGRFRGGYFLQFNGTAGLWRKNTIIESGNWQDDTLTEDLDLSYRSQLNGWKITYLNHLGSPAELPVEMNGLKSQQYRWMKGGAETAVKILPKLWGSSETIIRKLQGTIHLLSSSIFLFIFSAAILSIPMLLFMSYRDISAQFLGVFLAATLSIVAVYYSANVLQAKVDLKEYTQEKNLEFLGLFPMFLSLSMGLSFHNSVAVWDGLRGKKTSFIRTPKYNIQKKNDKFTNHPYLSRKIPMSTKIEIFLSLLFVACCIYGWITGYMSFIVFHFLLAMGFGGIAYYSIKHVKIHE